MFIGEASFSIWEPSIGSNPSKQRVSWVIFPWEQGWSTHNSESTEAPVRRSKRRQWWKEHELPHSILGNRRARASKGKKSVFRNSTFQLACHAFTGTVQLMTGNPPPTLHIPAWQEFKYLSSLHLKKLADQAVYGNRTEKNPHKESELPKGLIPIPGFIRLVAMSVLDSG